MARQFKESNDNPFHKEYGICSNTLYILKKCRQYCPSVLVIASIGIICNSVMSYYLGFFGKLVIDVVVGFKKADATGEIKNIALGTRNAEVELTIDDFTINVDKEVGFYANY